MGRRLFEEKGFNITGRVLPFDDFKFYRDLEGEYSIHPIHGERIIRSAEKMLDAEIPQLYAHEYMMFKRDGNRSVFESRYFPRRRMLFTLALAEYIEKKNRFTDKIIDLIWLILEETTWVLPAHNPQKVGIECPLPYAYADRVDFIDLFSATTAATLSFVYYLCKDILDSVSPIITDRMLYELDRRIIKPFLDDKALWDRCWWTGIRGNSVNNWCPWIVTNVLTVTALTVKDTTERTVIIKKALPMLDNFSSVYHPDGGCDEGPSYWNAAGGALYSACLVLYDMTGGYVNIYDDPLIKNMGEYYVKAVINDKRMLNFADSTSKINSNPALLYFWGMDCDSPMMINYAKWKLAGDVCTSEPDTSIPYRWMKYITKGPLEVEEFKPKTAAYIGGIEVAVFRETESIKDGLYIALKGGHNAESHNHNDLGNVIVFSGDTPIFIDAGAGKYTRKTFSPERYTIWAMRSDYHNCATFNGVTQENGAKYRSTDTVYDKENSKMTLCLTEAYPEAAGLKNYRRSSGIKDGKVFITDEVEFKDGGTVTFNYITRVAPYEVGEGYFKIEDRTVKFDASLSYAIEALDKTEPETAGIPGAWDTENLFRITLTEASRISKKIYSLTVE